MKSVSEVFVDNFMRCGIWVCTYCVQVQAHGDLAVAGVGDAVKPDLVAHVRHLVLFIHGIPLDLQRGRL